MFITVHKNVRKKNSDLKQTELLREILANSHPENVFSNDLRWMTFQPHFEQMNQPCENTKRAPIQQK